MDILRQISDGSLDDIDFTQNVSLGIKQEPNQETDMFRSYFDNQYVYERNNKQNFMKVNHFGIKEEAHDEFGIEDKKVHEYDTHAQDINEYLDIINEESEICEDNEKEVKIAINQGFDENGKEYEKVTKLKQNADNKYFCAICNKGFKKKNTMFQHIKNIHENNRPYCIICFRSFSKQSDLDDHIEKVHDKKKPFCEFCSKSYSSKNELDYHIARVHEKKKPLMCDFCCKRFAKNSELNKHVIAKHSGKVRFQCKKCDIGFPDKRSFQEHLDSVHEGKRYDCPHCDYKSAHKQYITEHISSVHEKKKPFKCNVCNKDFSQKSGLYLHNKRLHQTVGRPFKCDTCDKSYITSIELKSHIKHTHESTKNFFCKVCEVDILYIEKVAHINEYHNEKDGKVKCTKCDKTFATFNLLGKD